MYADACVNSTINYRNLHLFTLLYTNDRSWNILLAGFHHIVPWFTIDVYLYRNCVSFSLDTQTICWVAVSLVYALLHKKRLAVKPVYYPEAREDKQQSKGKGGNVPHSSLLVANSNIIFNATIAYTMNN